MKVYDVHEPPIGVKWRIMYPDKIHRLYELKNLLFEVPKTIAQARFNKFINYYINIVDLNSEINLKQLKGRYIEWLEKNN